jgi:hypothetical protein
MLEGSEKRGFWMAAFGSLLFLFATGLFVVIPGGVARLSPTPLFVDVSSGTTSTDPVAPLQEATLAAPTSTGDVSSSSTVFHVLLPDEVRGFYWTGYTAGSSRESSLLDYAVRSHLNSVVIDLKLDNGDLAFIPNDPQFADLAPKYPAIKDMDGLLSNLQEKGMYRIARVFIMRDGAFGKLHPSVVLRTANGAIWHDKTGTPWLDPAAPEVTAYAIALAREAYARGFDEVQFDYVRFPTDGRISAIQYPIYDGKTSKADVMRALFQQVGGTLQAEHIPVSFDLFGMTFWRTDDMNIGQRLSDAYPYADAVSPMVYPSHYPPNFEGYANPAQYPYEIVKKSLDKGVETLKSVDPTVDEAAARKKFRPWIQDFQIGAVYDAAKIEAQIKAARDAGASGWMIWNARNVYTPATYLK